MAIYSGYVGAKTCTKGPMPGARGFMAWYIAKYGGIGGQNSGIYNCRPVRGSTRTTSLHGEGRAVDLGLKYTREEFEILAEQLRRHSKELGIQCIIYNRKIWSGGYSSTGWVKYTGVNPHTDHLHVEMAWWSAKIGTDDFIALIEKTIGHKLTDSPAGDVKPAGKPKPSKPQISKQPTDFRDLVVDGVWGKESIKAFQIVMRAISKYNRAVDGGWGYYTQRALQAWLRDRKHYPSSKYVIDGKAGVATIKGLQAFLKSKGHLDAKKWKTDGVFGPETVKAFQRYLNTQNGK